MERTKNIIKSVKRSQLLNRAEQKNVEKKRMFAIVKQGGAEPHPYGANKEYRKKC